MYRQIMPSSTRARSTTFDLRFFSWKAMAAKRKLTITLPLLTIDTMLIIAPGSDNE